MIHFNEVTQYYGNQIVFDHASCHIRSGSFNGLFGGVGSGKSTFIKMLTSQIAPNGGMILFCQQKLKPLHGRNLEIHRSQIGLIDQKQRFLNDLSVEENIEILARISGRHHAEVGRETRVIAEQLGIIHYLKCPINTVSTGIRQLVQIARVLVHRPLVILADEPAQSLNQEITENLQHLLYEVSINFGTTVIVATNSPQQWEHPNMQRYFIHQCQIKESAY